MDIKPNDIINVPYEQFELLMTACCLQNDCENNLEKCRCLKLVEQHDEQFGI